MTERELLVDCLRRLNGTTITYYLTESMASNYWGIPRTTHDLDFVIQLPPSSIDKIVSAFSPDYFLDEHAVRAGINGLRSINSGGTQPRGNGRRNLRFVARDLCPPQKGSPDRDSKPITFSACGTGHRDIDALMEIAPPHFFALDAPATTE